jgi:hypothetical protein
MVEKIDVLAGSPLAWELAGRSVIVLDYARDMTLDKFGAAFRPDGHHRGRGPDPRYYYQAVVDRTRQIIAEKHALSDLDEEDIASRQLQAFVPRHFYLSVKDVVRRLDRRVTRYCWRLNGEALVVWLPVEIAGPHRRKWLETNIGPVDPVAPGERERVQELIDGVLGKKRLLSLSDIGDGLVSAAAGSDGPQSLEEMLTVQGLAETVIREKELNLDRQRPCIASLGAELAPLIRRIFCDLAQDAYKPSEIAREFGLSKSAMSRFAGVRWCARGTPVVPDLHKNVAFCLAHHRHFIEAAKAAGVWEAVQKVLSRSGRGANL